MSIHNAPHGAPRLALLALAALLLSTGAGCEKKPSTPAALKEVRLGYFANLTHGQALLGVASGDYEKAIAPAKLSTKIFNAGPSLIEALFAEEIDIGYVGPGPAINAFARTKGEAIRVIAGAAANGVVIVVRSDSGIQTLQDLKGKRIATPQLGNTQDISAKHYLRHTLGQSDVGNVLPVPNAEQASLMSRGEIDAAWAVEPWGQRIVADAGARILAEEKDLWPDQQFGLTLVVTTPEFLRDHRDMVKRFLAAHKEWTAKLAAEPQRYVPDLVKAIADQTGKEVPAVLLSPALSRVKFTDDPLPGSLTTFAQWAHELGFLREPPDITGLVDPSLLEELAR